jgi:hypothetical protein
MFNSTSRKLSGAALLAALTLTGAVGTLLAGSAEPAMALCKYGSPHCVNPNPGPHAPKPPGAAWPSSGWEDPDCQYYGSCGTGTPGNWGDPAARRNPPGGAPQRYGAAVHAHPAMGRMR